MGKAVAGKRICVACRVAVLSRYNSDPVCAGCARAAREASGIVPTWVWDSAPLRAALTRVDLASFAVLVRRSSRLSLEALGAVVADGWSKPLMSMIERGQRDTLYDIRKLLEFVDSAGIPRTALAPLILGDPGVTLDDDDVAAWWGVDTMDLNRRGFTALSAGLAMAAALPVPQRVDLAHVRYLQTALVRLHDQDDVLGGGGVLPQCLRLFARARRMLDESDYTAAVGQQLLAVTADLGIKSAWSAYDADNQALARRLYEQSALLVDSAEDNAQRAYLYANMVQQSTCLARYTGRKDLAREALRFAERAEDAAPSRAVLGAARAGLAAALPRARPAGGRGGVPLGHHHRPPRAGSQPARSRHGADQVRPPLGDHRIRGTGQSPTRRVRPGPAAARSGPRRHHPFPPRPVLLSGTAGRTLVAAGHTEQAVHQA